MMSAFLSTDDRPDWFSVSETSIELETEQIEHAVQLSQTVPHADAQWQTYLNGLALFGFEQWLAEWMPDSVIDHAQCSLFQPAYANLIEVVCNLHVNQFRLCLIVSCDRTDSVVECAKAAIELADFVPDFYVLVEVMEEEMQVDIYGYQRHDILQQHLQTHTFAPTLEWFYPLQCNWFNPEPTSLLLELRGLEAKTWARSPLPSPALLSVAQLQTRFATLAPQLRSAETMPQQLLTWKEGATILRHPELVEELLQIGVAGRRQKAEEIQNSKFKTLQNTEQNTSSSINVAAWMRDRLDAVAQELAWLLMPALTPAMAELRTADPFTDVQSALADTGLTIPPEARGAYQELSVNSTLLRLYAIAWALPPANDPPEWSLLVVLSAFQGEGLPRGMGLQVSADGELLTNPIAESTAIPHIYTRVIGTWDEQFCFAISLPNGERIQFPPFAFQPE